MIGKKMLKIIVISVILVLTISSFSFAISVIPDTKPDISSAGDKPYTMANNIIGMLKWIGYAIAIGMVIFVGIKYVMASADEKANMKGVLVKVVVGALIIAFANMIVNIVLGIAGT